MEKLRLLYCKNQQKQIHFDFQTRVKRHFFEKHLVKQHHLVSHTIQKAIDFENRNRLYLTSSLSVSS